MAKTDARRWSPSVQEALRYLLVAYLRKGHTQKQGAEVFGLSLIAVKRIWKRYKQGGKRALVSKSRGGQKTKKINGRQAVGQLLEHRYGICLSRWQIERYLATWGFTPQKPVRKATEQNKGLVKCWLEQQYPGIRKRAAKQGAIIYWGDETSMRSDHQAGRSYAPKGQTPEVKASGRRFSLSMISAVSNRGHLQFMIVEGSFNSAVFIHFLEQLIKSSRKKIFLIVNHHPVRQRRCSSGSQKEK